MTGFRGGNQFMYQSTEVVSLQEVKKAVGTLTNEKAASLDKIIVKMITNGDDWVCNLLRRLRNKTFEGKKVSEDWKNGVILQLYKEKGEKSKCKNYRDINLLSVVRKMYKRILIKPARRITNEILSQQQRSFTTGGICVDQVFVRQVA